MTAMFRAIGASFRSFNVASQLSGLVLPAIVVYIGFLIQKPQMHPWFVWIFWVDPLAYAFDALLSNELHDKIIACVGNNLVPSGPTYNSTTNQGCAGVLGSVEGRGFVTGTDYLSALTYSEAHIWSNFAIIWAFWALFIAITIFATTRWRSSAERGSSLLIPRERALAHQATSRNDEETPAGEKSASGNSSVYRGSTVAESSDEGSGGNSDLMRNSSIYTWKNVTYTVNTADGEKVLLDNVQGWVKPGMLGALMGSSGAGKTTLLDVLAQRKTEGTISGSILVDGRPLPVSFQRSAGYCEQLDVHEPLTTVREALEFSALLRQNRETPRAEKLKYVDTIIDLLELHDLADTMIGTVGNGLNVEQRKRVTIGVELVAKPSILIFLDEPTSGLDGQSAYNTVRFLRKLAAHGQAVLVTIHQPSAQLFAQFDTLLLLAKGGKMVYFGDIGAQAQTVKSYFARHGAPCPQNANPAEHMIDVVSGHLSKGRDWNQVWLASPEQTAMTQELDRIIEDAAAKPPGTVDDGHEFATTLWEQTKLVTRRMNISLYRNTDYINNKIILHLTSALFTGFTFFQVRDSVGDLQSRVFAVWQFIFVAPGVIAQLQPLFIARRDIFEAREKKSKMYSWTAFVTGLILSEIPYLFLCGILYFFCWYFTVGFPLIPARAGAVLFVVLVYELLYTGLGQFVAAYAPNEVFAALVNPLLVSFLVSFCGILVPYHQIQAFWRYWMYWVDPFTYLMSSLLVFTSWGQDVQCKGSEFAVFDPPNGTTCGAYLADYMRDGLGAASNLVNPDATESCKVCSYTLAQDYLRTMHIDEYYYGWRDTGIIVIFVFSSYSLVYIMMKLRTKTSKTAQ